VDGIGVIIVAPAATAERHGFARVYGNVGLPALIILNGVLDCRYGDNDNHGGGGECGIDRLELVEDLQHNQKQKVGVGDAAKLLKQILWQERHQRVLGRRDPAGEHAQVWQLWAVKQSGQMAAMISVTNDVPVAAKVLHWPISALGVLVLIELIGRQGDVDEDLPRRRKGDGGAGDGLGVLFPHSLDFMRAAGIVSAIPSASRGYWCKRKGRRRLLATAAAKARGQWKQKSQAKASNKSLSPQNSAF
jgi:hypothetical protein